MIRFRSIEINDSIVAGSRVDNAVGYQGFVRFICFDFVEFGKIFVIVSLIIEVVAGILLIRTATSTTWMLLKITDYAGILFPQTRLRF